MAVTFQLPAELERNLRQEFQDLDGQAKEGFLVGLYRRGKLSHLALSKALGLDRLETEQVLVRHNVTEDLGTAEDYLAEAGALRELRDGSR